MESRINYFCLMHLPVPLEITLMKLAAVQLLLFTYSGKNRSYSVKTNKKVFCSTLPRSPVRHFPSFAPLRHCSIALMSINEHTFV